MLVGDSQEPGKLTDIVEVLVGELLAGVSSLDAGAVDENANLVAIGEDLGNESADGRGRGEVGGVDRGLAAELLNGLLGVGSGGVSLKEQSQCQGLILVEARDDAPSVNGVTHLDQDDVGTSFGEANGNGLANATGATGDDGRVALEGEEGGGHRK